MGARAAAAAVAAAAGAVLACASVAADHEILGDRAYIARDFRGALVEYRIALKQRAPNARLRAKAAAAALRAEDLYAAAEEYRALAREAKDRTGEAADGLERVARAAAEQRDRVAFTSAWEGLQETTGGRALGSIAQDVAWFLGDEAPSAELLAALPYAAAAAPDARREDSLVFVYGSGLAQRGRCEAAAAVLEGVARRQREPAVVAAARRGAAFCSLQVGRRALDAGQSDKAEEWFRRVITAGDRDDYTRVAYLGLGDVFFARGAFAAAADAYQQVIGDGQPGDSLAQMAAERLNRTAQAGTVDR